MKTTILIKEARLSCYVKRNSKIPKGQTEIVKSEDRQDHGQQNKSKDIGHTTLH